MQPQNWFELLLPLGMHTTTPIFKERLQARKRREEIEAQSENLVQTGDGESTDFERDPFDLLSPHDGKEVRRLTQGAYGRHPKLMYEAEFTTDSRNARTAQ